MESGACFDSEASNLEDENWLLIFRNVVASSGDDSARVLMILVSLGLLTY